MAVADAAGWSLFPDSLSLSPDDTALPRSGRPTIEFHLLNVADPRDSKSVT
jgi:hypothetical protein